MSDQYIQTDEWVEIEKVSTAAEQQPVYNDVNKHLSEIEDDMSEPLYFADPDAARGDIDEAIEQFSIGYTDSNIALKTLQDLADYLIFICDGPLAWMNAYPEITDSNEEQILQNIEESEEVCKQAEGRVAEAMVQMGTVSQDLFDYKTLLDKSINELEQDKLTAAKNCEIKKQEEIEQIPGIPYWAYDDPIQLQLQIDRIEASQEAIINSCNEELEQDNQSLDRWISEVSKESTDGTEYRGSAEDWMDVASDINLTLGEVLVNLQTLEDTLLLAESTENEMYLEFLQLQWQELRSNAVQLQEEISFW